jgi:Undecaprenyl-phosphate glucose phosphotransferase
MFKPPISTFENETSPVQKQEVGGINEATPRRAPSASPIARAHNELAICEFATVFLTGLLSKFFYLDLFVAHRPDWLPYVLIALAVSAIQHITYGQMGLYEIDQLTDIDLNFGKLFGGLIIAFLVVLGVLYATKQAEDVSRGWTFTWLAMAAVVLVYVRANLTRRIRQAMATGRLRRRVAIVGTSAYAAAAGDRVRANQGAANDIHLYAPQVPEGDSRFAGTPADLEAAMSRQPYDRVIVAMPASDTANIRNIVRSLGSYTTDLLLCTDLTKPIVSTASARHMGGLQADVVHLIPGSEDQWIVKRSIDVTLATILLLLLSPLLLIVAAAIKLESDGPVFFKQRRFGQNNSVFKIFKFRSMLAAEDGPVVIQATRNDRRITRVGRVIRATSIDELPQLINVLLGQMSLVGPRPHAIAHDQIFEQQFDLFSRRRRVKPGITGWAQVNGFRGETKTPEDARRRMDHDLYYIDRWSIWFDIEILARTVFVFSKGAY